MNKILTHYCAPIVVFLIVSKANARINTDIVWHGQSDERQIETNLYESKDHVVILDSSNLKNIITDSPTAWLVEFYASWCPHCVQFSSIWKTFSHSIDNWKDIVNVGVIDCGNDKNLRICGGEEYNVEAFPDIRYFASYSPPGTLGKSFNKSDDPDLLRKTIMTTLENDQYHQFGDSGVKFAWLMTLEVTNVFAALSAQIKYYFLLFEEPQSHLGLTAILDFHNVPHILFRRVSSHNEKLCDLFQVKSFPQLTVINRENRLSILILRTPSRVAVYNALRDFMMTEGMKINFPNIMADSVIMQNYIRKKTTNRSASHLVNDNIYQADLAAALRYSLEQEIAGTRRIHGVKMKILKKYLQVLAKYFPTKFGPRNYLNNIYSSIVHKSAIGGRDFWQLITSLNNDSGLWHKTTWIGCRGSESHKRGYTCGLWIMFHTLTVRHAISIDKNHLTNDNDGRMIPAIHGYIKHFFKCWHCAKHFDEMARKRKSKEIDTANGAVMWLWKAHNEVNSRLAGDVTEDPKFPKIQYPAREHCPKCRNINGTWDEIEVLKYMKKKYGGPYIRHY